MADGFFVMDPNSHLDYPVTWADFLAGDTIATSTFTVVDVGITIDTPTFTTTTTKIWATGGVVGKEYRVVNHITTAQGLAEDKTIVFLVEQK